MEVLWKFGFRNLFKKQYKKYSLTLKTDECINHQSLGYISGSNIFFRKTVLDEVGCFDEKFFLYYEETDLCKRIKDIGYDVVIVKDAEIIHLEGKSSNNLLLVKKRSKRSEYYYFKKHHPNQVVFIKILYIILYFIDGYINGNTSSKELLLFVYKEWR